MNYELLSGLRSITSGTNNNDENDLHANFYPVTLSNLTNITNEYLTIDVNKSIDVNRAIRKSLPKINNDALKNFTSKVLIIFQELTKSYHDKNGYLPPLMLNQLEDGSILIEWVNGKFRMGMQIEKDINESKWFIIDSSTKEFKNEYGALNNENMRDVIEKIFETALQY